MKSDKPKISVVTVSYNAVDTIEETMLSVLNQTYLNIEYIIIDGGSTDGTVDIIKKYADRLAYWVSEPDKGIYDAMNKGINAATGDYIYFLGGDDTLLNSTIINEIFDTVDINCKDIIYGNVILQPSGKIYGGKFTKWKLIRKNICHQAIFYPRSALKEHPYTLRFRAYADYYENIQLWGGRYKFTYKPISIANFVVGGFSITGDQEFMRERGNIVYDKLGFAAYVYYLFRVKIINLLKR